MNKIQKLDRIRATGIIAIMRANSSDQLIAAADAIAAGGVNIIEVTMTTPGALRVIEQAKQRYGDDVLFGAGSILDKETARAAILSGADFIVGPTYDFGLIALCNRYSIPVIPGCYTPTEMLSAWEAGADMINLFPARIGGPTLIKEILAPLPQLEIVPVGGVNLKTAEEFIKNGAAAIGVGSALISQALLNANDMEKITRKAEAFIQEIKKGRGS